MMTSTSVQPPWPSTRAATHIMATLGDDVERDDDAAAVDSSAIAWRPAGVVRLVPTVGVAGRVCCAVSVMF